MIWPVQPLGQALQLQSGLNEAKHSESVVALIP